MSWLTGAFDSLLSTTPFFSYMQLAFAASLGLVLSDCTQSWGVSEDFCIWCKRNKQKWKKFTSTLSVNTARDQGRRPFSSICDNYHVPLQRISYNKRFSTKMSLG